MQPEEYRMKEVGSLRRFEQFHNLLLPYLCFLLEQHGALRNTELQKLRKHIKL